MPKQYINVKEVEEALSTSEGKAYGVIQELNNQLKSQGCITISDKVNRRFFEEKCFYAVKVVGD